MVRHWKRRAVFTLAAVAFAATSASAQFNFYTEGQFSGTGCTSGSPSTCKFGVAPNSLTLGFNTVSASEWGYLSGSQVTLGHFTAQGNGDMTLVEDDVYFTLFIYQTAPELGSTNSVGSITGRLKKGGGPAFSSLLWSPSQVMTIDPVTYTMIFDEHLGGIAITSEGAEIKALGTVTPEPASLALLGTGLAGLVGAARRRRKRDQAEV